MNFMLDLITKLGKRYYKVTKGSSFDVLKSRSSVITKWESYFVLLGRCNTLHGATKWSKCGITK